ncbi:MAG: hypothetical protein CSA82_02160 [Actinobacteria bacterium]|nr:MAG: hypothetical protein CSA82_02160 [Actinomycetota bacterium]
MNTHQPPVDPTEPLPVSSEDIPKDDTATMTAADEVSPSKSDDPDSSASPSSAASDQDSPTSPRQEAASPAQAPLSTQTPFSDMPEAPARGIRVGQLIWGGLVVVLGIFLIAAAFVTNIDFPVIFISLVGALGIALIIAAVASSFSARRKKK